MTRLFALGFALTMAATAEVKVEKTAYAGWPNCYRMTNGEVELIVTTDIGPRVMRYGFVGGRNLFVEFKEQLGKSGETAWQARGGHRLWFAPEDAKDTYALDNTKIAFEISGPGTITLTGNIEPETGLQKQMIITMDPKGSHVRVMHHLKNTGKKARRLAPWALTMMAQGGTAITGFPPRGSHPKDLLPTNTLTMWAYTDLSDPRWKFTSKYLILRQDPKNPRPQKLGHFNPKTWGAYLLGTDLFIKQYAANPSRPYPDMGASYETFTNNQFLEIETVGPLVDLQPGATVDHQEDWTLHRNVKIAAWTDAALDRVIPSRLNEDWWASDRH